MAQSDQQQQDMLAKMQKFAEWMYTPDILYIKPKRDPATGEIVRDKNGRKVLLQKPDRSEVARELGVARQTTYEWEDSQYWPDVSRRAIAVVRRRITPDLIKAAWDEMLVGNHHMHNTYWRFITPVLEVSEKLLETGELNTGLMTREELLEEFGHLSEGERQHVIAIFQGTGKLLPSPDQAPTKSYNIFPRTDGVSPRIHSDKNLLAQLDEAIEAEAYKGRARLSDIGK